MAENLNIASLIEATSNPNSGVKSRHLMAMLSALAEQSPPAPAPAPEKEQVNNIQTQSQGLSNRHLNMHQDGRTLVDDSNVSEGNLKTIIEPLLERARALIAPHGGTIQYLKKVSMEDLVMYMRNPKHIIDDNSNSNSIDARVSIKPDAGIIMWTFNGIQYPLYIGEDKVQGTNDQLHAAGKKRQATGNAIERYFKNVRAEEMLCSNVPYFPSVVFAAGCDFHHTETIAKRLEVGNYGTPNHYLEISPEKTADSDVVAAQMQSMVKRISIYKRIAGKYAPAIAIPSVCVKAHKWDTLPHNSSLWKPHEYLAISERVLELAVNEVVQLVQREADHAARTNAKRTIYTHDITLYNDDPFGLGSG